jgi:hypothetical protein
MRLFQDFHLHPGFKYKGNQSLFYAQSAEQIDTKQITQKITLGVLCNECTLNTKRKKRNRRKAEELRKATIDAKTQRCAASPESG